MNNINQYECPNDGTTWNEEITERNIVLILGDITKDTEKKDIVVHEVQGLLKFENVHQAAQTGQFLASSGICDGWVVPDLEKDWEIIVQGENEENTRWNQLFYLPVRVKETPEFKNEDLYRINFLEPTHLIAQGFVPDFEGYYRIVQTDGLGNVLDAIAYQKHKDYIHDCQALGIPFNPKPDPKAIMERIKFGAEMHEKIWEATTENIKMVFPNFDCIHNEKLQEDITNGSVDYNTTFKKGKKEKQWYIEAWEGEDLVNIYKYDVYKHQHIDFLALSCKE